MLPFKLFQVCFRCKSLPDDHASFRILEFLFEIGLLILTVFFVSSACGEFTEGKTHFVETNVALTTQDNPTITVCFGTTSNITFNSDFTTRYRYWNKSSWAVDETMIRKMSVVATTRTEYQNCFMFKKVAEDISGDKKIYLELTFTEELLDSVNSFKPWVFITSEENAYGVTTQRWFDGEVFKFYLQKHKESFIELSDIHQYEYLKHMCSVDTFYECVIETMSSSGECLKHGGLCEAVSLPKVLPPCKSEDEHTCTLRSFWNVYNNSNCMREKTCTNTEYIIERGPGFYYKTTDNMNATFSFGYGFVSSASQARLIQPHKTVHSEYLVWSEFTLVAYVGGMLGLTLGISLLDIYHWIMNKGGQALASFLGTTGPHDY